MQKVRLGYSRRRFMKTSLACLAGTALESKALQSHPHSKSKQAVSRTSLKSLRAFPTTCNLCAGGCGILAYLDGDRLVQLLGNPDHPVNRGRICAKGLAGLNLVYDPERLLFPMKRIGKRGEGRWTRITWDEAHEMMISQIRQLNSKNNFVLDQGQFDPILDLFIQSMENFSIIDRKALNRKNRALAFKMMTGSPVFLPDFSKNRIILNFGANPFAHHDQFIGVTRHLMRARTENGSKLLSFDVRMSETAAKSDRWIPVKSGTDGIVALAMAHTILKNDLADTEFISKKTNMSLPALQSHLSDYPSSRAEEESGIKASVIENIAIEFATRKPSVAIAGGGVSDQKNGVNSVRSILLLNWLVGSAPSSFSPSTGPQTTETLNGTRDLVNSDSEINIYLSYSSNPVFEEPDSSTVTQFFKDETKVKFIAVLDTHMTETALLADLVLPAATYLESWGIDYVESQDQIPTLNLRQPVVSLQSPAKILRSPDFEMGKVIDPSFLPIGDAKEVGNVCIEWARRMQRRLSPEFSARNTFDFYSQTVDQMPGSTESGGFKSLKNSGFRIEKSGIQDLKSHPGISEFDKVNINPFPHYQTASSNSTEKKSEFSLTTYKTGFFAHEIQNSKWLREIAHDNPLWINRNSAEVLGIKNGDLLRISAELKSLVTRALVTDRIHPKSVALAQGFGHTATGRVAKSEKFKSRDRDTSLLWWKKEGKGINPNELIVGQRDPVSGVFSAKDTLVKIEKI